MVSDPVRKPVATGLNTTLMVQLAPAATVVQVLVWVRSALTTMLAILSDAAPVLASVIVFALLIVPTRREP
jgi:hypothetical protein